MRTTLARRFNNQGAVKPLVQLVAGVRMVDIGSSGPRFKLVCKDSPWHHALLGDAGDTIHGIGDRDPMPVDTCFFGKLIFKKNPYDFSFLNTYLRSWHLPIIGPCDKIRSFSQVHLCLCRSQSKCPYRVGRHCKGRGNKTSGQTQRSCCAEQGLQK